MSLNLATILRESARSHPAKPIFLGDGYRVTYAELDAPPHSRGLRRPPRSVCTRCPASARR